MGDTPPRLVEESIGGLFHDLVRDALAAESVTTSDATEYYLAGLLNNFVRAEPNRFLRVFGMELLGAGLLKPAERYVILKGLADASLFMSGIFLDHLEASLPATEYFFDIGSRAYLDLGALDENYGTASAEIADTYVDLGERFPDFVRVLSEISDSRLFMGKAAELRLYERWLEHGGSRDTHRLIRLGIIPADSDSKIKH